MRPPLDLCLVGFNHFRNNIVQLTDNPVMGDGKDRSSGIGINGNDLFAVIHSSAVLNRTADAAGDVQFRTNGYPGLSDLMIMIYPAGVNRGA